jgi:hypothetical protein
LACQQASSLCWPSRVGVVCGIETEAEERGSSRRGLRAGAGAPGSGSGLADAAADTRVRTRWRATADQCRPPQAAAVTGAHVPFVTNGSGCHSNRPCGKKSFGLVVAPQAVQTRSAAAPPQPPVSSPPCLLRPSLLSSARQAYHDWSITRGFLHQRLTFVQGSLVISSVPLPSARASRTAHASPPAASPCRERVHRTSRPGHRRTTSYFRTLVPILEHSNRGRYHIAVFVNAMYAIACAVPSI